MCSQNWQHMAACEVMHACQQLPHLPAAFPCAEQAPHMKHFRHQATDKSILAWMVHCKLQQELASW